MSGSYVFSHHSPADSIRELSEASKHAESHAHSICKKLSDFAFGILGAV